MVNIICKICNKQFNVFPSRAKTAKYCSSQCKFKGQKGLFKGCNNPMWKGDNVGYKAIHDWLSKNYGKANRCDNPTCKNISSKFEWSLRKSYNHSHNISHYWQLCATCHRIYDKTDESKKKTSNTLKGHASWNNWETIKKDTDGRFSK